MGTTVLYAVLLSRLMLPTALTSAPVPSRESQGVSSLPAIGSATPVFEEIIVTQRFERHVADYVALHRLLEGPLPTLQVSSDLRVVRAAMAALATKIQAARPHARQGDLFARDVARMFRKRIAGCVSPEDMAAILAEREEARSPIPPRLRVNAVWPELMPFNFVPPQLIAALPPLPPELQYRIIGRSLVLWDHHANLIVDFLPGAFAS